MRAKPGKTGWTGISLFAGWQNCSPVLADNLNAKTMAVVVTHPDGWVVMLAADALELEMPFSWS